MAQGAAKQRETVKVKKGKLAETVFLELVVAQSRLSRPIEKILRAQGLTPVTYNILRILRGAGPRGLTCGEIGERMLTRVPDVTRLVDRLVRLGVIQRFRTDQDRRRVFQAITPQGLTLLTRLDDPIMKAHRAGLGTMRRRQLDELLDLLLEIPGDRA